MALTVDEQPLVDEVQQTREGLTGRRVFVVRSDDASEVTSLAALGAAGVPVIGAPYDVSLPGFLVSTRNAQAAEGWDMRLVELTYEELGYTPVDNPLNEPDAIAWTWQETTESYVFDRSTPDALPVITSAGQPFKELPVREGSSLVATIRRNIQTFDFAAADDYRNAINSASFTVDGVNIGARQAKLNVVGLSEPTVRNGVDYRELTIQLKFKADWRDYFADRGTKQLASGNLVAIVAGTPPQPVDDDWPLDGSGAAKANSTDTPAVLTFKPYSELSFAAWSFT